MPSDPTIPLPSAPDMERGVLSCMMQAPDFAIGRAVSAVSAPDFHIGAHKILFETMLDMQETGVPVEPVALMRVLTDRSLLEKAGGPAEIMEIYGFAAGASNVAHYAKQVREKASCRRIVLQAYTLLEAIQNEPESWRGHCTAMVNRCVDEQTGTDEKAVIEPIKAALFDALDQLEEAFKNRGHVTHGVALGFTDVDRTLNGLAPGDNVVIAGATSMGKSAFAMGLMENLAMAEGHYREYYQDAKEWPACIVPRQKPVCCVYVMLESKKVALANRLICGRSQIGVQRIRDGMLKSNDFQLIGRCASQLAEAPIFVLDESDLTVEMLEMKLKAFKQQHPELGAVFVDHCGLLSAKAIKEGEATAKATYVSGRLRKLWKAIDVIGFPMWQLSREVEKTASKRPNKSHLRDSGNIENDATHILMLYRPSYYFPDSNEHSDSDGYAIVAKNREGPVNLEGVPLEWVPQIARYKSKSSRLYSNNEDERQEF